MSNVIAFLETMGQKAGLRYAGRAVLYGELTQRQIDPDARWAILRGDAKQLASLLGAPKIVCCNLQKQDEDEEEPSKEEEPSRDDEITTRSTIRVFASAA